MNLVLALFILGLLFNPLLVRADPFLVSNTCTSSGTLPTHCYVYVDGEVTASLKSPVGVNSDGTVYCRVNLQPLTVGIHTAKISSVLEVAGVVTAEAPPATLTPITKDACSDATLCEYKYQFAGAIVWYK